MLNGGAVSTALFITIHFVAEAGDRGIWFPTSLDYYYTFVEYDAAVMSV